MSPPEVKTGSPVVVTPPPVPLTEDEKQVLTEDHKAPAPSAPPHNDQELKKITSDVSSMGVKLPDDMLENGTIKPDKLGAAKDFIKKTADERKGKDIGAAARLMKRAVALDPKDEKLRLETAKTWLEWQGQTKDPKVRKVQLEEAYGFIKDINTQQLKNPEFAQVKFSIAHKLAGLNVGHFSDADASKWLGIAIENATPDQVQEVLKGLKEYPHPEILGWTKDPYLFIAESMINASRFEDARKIYTQAVNEATDPKLKENYLKFYHMFDSVDKPYSRSFDGNSNPVAQELYDALRKHKIPDAAFKGADGKAEHPADDKIWPGEVLKYIDTHLDSPDVQAALKEAKIEIPPSLKKDIKEKGFSRAMSDYHAAEAKKLSRSESPEDKKLCSAHLRIAVGFDGDNVELRNKFGKALMRSEQFADAAKAFDEVHRRQPLNTEVLLDLARAQVGAGEPQKALDALKLWDNGISVFKTPEKIGEVETLRSQAGSLRLKELTKLYDQAKTSGTRDEQLRLLDEMAECPKSSSGETYSVLQAQRDFYAKEVKRPDADSFDKRHAQEDLDKIDKRIETLRDSLKESSKIGKGETPSARQLDDAKTAAKISQTYGDLSDWLRYNELVKAAPADVMDTKAKLDAYGDVFRALRTQTRTSETDDVARQIQELAQDYLSSGKAKDYLEAVLKKGNGPELDLLSAEGLKKMQTEVDAGYAALALVAQKTDIKEKRGCMIEALKHFGAVGDNAKAQEIAKQIEATIPADMPRSDKLQIYGLMAGVLKDSKLSPQDGATLSLAQEYQNKGKDIAVDIIGKGNMGPPFGAERIKELLVAKAFCDSTGDIDNANVATLRLSGAQGQLLTDFSDPKYANDPTKAKERLENARLLVQIDLELMGGRLNSAAKIVQEIADGKRPASDRDLLNADYKRFADHIAVWQDQLALAKDLPVDERLAEGTKIAASLGRYKLLTQGDKPLLKPEDLKAVSARFEKTMGAIFADCMEQGPNATEADKKMAADIVNDMKGRLKLDIEDGNMIWSSQLDPKKLIQFAETAQNAHKLMDEAKTKGSLDPVGVQRYMQAAALFAQIGCKDRVKEAMLPVEVFETGMTNNSDKIALDFSIAQIYTMSGMTREANTILWRAAQMKGDGYPAEVRELATVAQGMIHLNNGDTDKAKAELEKVPNNKTAQELLRGITAGGRELRINQAMQIARTWLFSLEDKNMSPEKQALLEQGLDDLLHKAKTLMLEGKAANFQDALRDASRTAPVAVRSFAESNLLNSGNDALPNDPQGRVLNAITVMADPNVSDETSARAAITLSNQLIAAGERYYGNAGQIAQFMSDNAYVGTDAKKIINDKIPEYVKAGAIFSGLKGLACATPVGAFCMIFFAGSSQEANEAVVNSLISIGSFGIARGLAVGAEALWVAKMATVIESPVIMGVTKFGVRTVTEAAAFPVAGALLTTAFTGKVDHWNPQHFKTEFLSMLVTFTLLHGAGIPLSKFTGRAERSVLEAQEALKLARQTGQGVEAAESALSRAAVYEKMAKGIGWAGNVAAFTGAEYANEALGLKPDEKGVPFWMKFLGCAVTDAQMKFGGKVIDGVTNGKLTRMEANTAKILQVHGEMGKFNASVGVGSSSPEFLKAVQTRINGDDKFNPATFMTDAQATMKLLEPALKDVPKDKQDQVRQGLLLEIAEGKLDTKLAQTLAKRVKAGQSEIIPKEDGKGYDLVPGKKSVEAKEKEDKRQADAQKKSEQKRIDDAKKKAEDQKAEALKQQQEKAFQQREKARTGEFEKGFGFREKTRKDGVVLGIEKYDTKSGEAVNDTAYTVEDLKSFKDYQAKQTAKKELRSGFEKGDRVLPNAKEPGKFQLLDVNGEVKREATSEECADYLKFKTDTKAFQAAEKLRADAIAKVKGERVAALESEFDNGTVVRPKVEKGYKVELSNADDPNAFAAERNGKVGYYVRVNADGTRQKASADDVGAFEKARASKPKATSVDIPDRTNGLEKVSKDGTSVAATKDDLDTYTAWQGKKEAARAKADAETKLKQGFGEGQQIFLNADTGNFELVDAKGKTIRVATDDEHTLFSQFETEQQQHKEGIEKRAKDLAPQFEDKDHPAIIRPQVKKAPTYKASDVNDPNAAAVEGPGGKVQYITKVMPDGTIQRPTGKEASDFVAGKAPKDEVTGYEKVVDGKVVDGNVAKNDFEAFQAWQKGKAKAQVLEAGKKQDEAMGELIPFPAAKVDGEGKVDIAALRDARQAAREKILDQILDQASGQPPSAADLAKAVDNVMEAMDVLGPALDKLPEGTRDSVEAALERKIMDGSLTRNQVYDLAEKASTGEITLVPVAGPEGFKVETNAKGAAPGVAKFVPMTDVEAKAAKIAKAAPSPERIARYEQYLIEKKGYSPADAKEAAQKWAKGVIEDAQAHQAGRTHIYDTSLPMKPENAHLDRATVDHHGRFANKKNSTEQLVDRMEAALDVAKSDPKNIEAAKKDKAAMAQARQGLIEAGIKNPSEQQTAEIAAGLRELNLKEVTTDNLADGAWSVWIAKHQARVLADPALRKTINDATHFEDFTAFGTTYDPKDPSIRLQASLFQKYGEILQRNGIIGSDRFPPDKAQVVMGEALRAIDQMVGDPVAREKAAGDFFTQVEEARKVAGTDGLMKDASVHDGDVNLSVFDLTKLGKFTVFQQWLALPRVEAQPGQPHTMQVSVVPLGKAKMADGALIDAPRSLQIVAIPDGRNLPSGKTMLDAKDRMNAMELAKAEELGLVPKEGEEPKPGQYSRADFSNVWFGKENVILPNPAKGTLLSPKEVSDILTDRAPSSKDKPLEMFVPKRTQSGEIQKDIDALLPDGPPTKVEKLPTPKPANDGDTRIDKKPALIPSEIEGTPADAPVSKRGGSMGNIEFTGEILPSVIARGSYKPAESPLQKGEMVLTLQDWVKSDAAPKTPEARKQLLEDLRKGQMGEPGGKVLMILDGQVVVETTERARARLELRDTMMSALASCTKEPAKALKEWVGSGEAPKTFEEWQKFGEDLQRAARGDPEGKVILTDSSGKMVVETLKDVKARLEAGKQVLGELAKGKPAPTREQQEALLWRASLNAGKSPDSVKEDLQFAWDNLPKLATETSGLPKNVADSLGVRYLRGDTTFFNVKQFATKYREARANAEKLGIGGEKFDETILKSAEDWQADYAKNPSAAVEATLKNFGPTLEVLSGVAPMMTKEVRQSTAQRVLEGKITLDQAYEVMTAQTLGGIVDGVESGVKPEQLKQIYSRALESAYKPNIPGNVRENLDRLLAAKDPVTLLEEGFSRSAYNLQIPADRYQKFADSIKDLDPASQAALLINLEMHMQHLFGPGTTSGGISTADRVKAESLFQGTEALAKQMKGLDPTARKRLADDVLNGKKSLDEAVMAADRPSIPPPPGASGDQTRIDKLPADDANLIPTNPIGIRAPKVDEYQLPKAFEGSADLKKQVVFLANGETPFAEAARQVIEGKITTVEEYQAAQKKVGEKMVADNKPAYDDVMATLGLLAKDPSLHLSKDHPPTGRMKDPGDIGPKLARRGWNDASPLTDVAGTRIVVRSNADAEAVIARLQSKYKIREVYTKDGEIEVEPMSPDAKKAAGAGDESNVVWVDAKLDKDGIHRLVDGHPASGYRALHVVVEVNGHPVEIQIKTEAMHEWGEIEHKLVYKNKDLPKSVSEPIEKFRKDAADYLSKASEGKDPGEMPKAPTLADDVPNRAEIQKNLDDMTALMKKYEPKKAVDADKEPTNVIPLRRGKKAAGADAKDDKTPLPQAADAGGEISGISKRLAQHDSDPDAQAALLKPFEDLAKGLEAHDKDLGAKVRADIEALKTEDPGSEKYKAAAMRLNDAETFLNDRAGDSKEPLKPTEVVDIVRSAYESDAPTLKMKRSLLGTGGEGLGGLAVLIGLGTALFPRDAMASDGKVAGMGMTEFGMIAAIAGLIALPTLVKAVRSKWFKPTEPPPPPATKADPVKAEQDTGKFEVRPFTKDDMKSKQVKDYDVTKIDADGTMVIGDKVYVSFKGVKAPGAEGGSGDNVVAMSRRDAQRLGIKFDKMGGISEVPKGEFALKSTPTAKDSGLPVAADVGPPAPLVPTEAVDASGQKAKIQPLGVTDTKDGDPALRSFGRVTGVEPVPGDPDKVRITVDTYDPADPKADPTMLTFGLAKPEVIEQRSFVVSRDEAVKSFGVKIGKDGATSVGQNNYVVVNDEPSDVTMKNPLFVPTGGDSGYYIASAKMSGKNAIGVPSRIVEVDTKATSRHGDTIFVYFRTKALPGEKSELVSADPIALPIAEARKLGITMGAEGGLRIAKNEFMLADCKKTADNKISIDGHPFEGDKAPISVRLVQGGDGKMHLQAGEGAHSTEVGEGKVLNAAPSKEGGKIPDALKALGPLGFGIALLWPGSAHAEMAQPVADAMASGGLVAAGIAVLGIMVGLPIIFSAKGKGGAPLPSPTQGAFEVPAGVTRFSVQMDRQGRPTTQFAIGNSNPVMTFERSPEGQWYAFDGNPPKTRDQSLKDPELAKRWVPVKDGDLYQVSGPYGGTHVIPFKAPAEGWIPGYAPPPLRDGVPLQPAVPGKLPVGEVRSISVRADGTKFTIGRDPGSSLRFDDTSVSRTQATVMWSAEEGCFIVADGGMGKDKSLNGVLVNGVKIPPDQKFVKVPAQGNSANYISINGAYFKLEPPQTPVVGVQANPMGFFEANVGGQRYALGRYRFGDTALVDPTTIHGRVLEAHVSDVDANNGRISLRLQTYRMNDASGWKGEIYLKVTREEAAQMGLKIRPDGTLDPAGRRDEITFKPFTEADLQQPALKQAALNPGVDAPPAVRVPPPPPRAVPVKLEPVQLQDGSGAAYKLQHFDATMGLDHSSRLGTVTRLDPLPGNSGGRLMMVVEVRDGLAANAPKKSVTFSVSPAEARKMGLEIDAYGRITPNSPRELRVIALEPPPPQKGPVDLQADGRNFVMQPDGPQAEGWSGKVTGVKTVAGKPDQVMVDVTYTKAGFGDPYETSIPMTKRDAMRLGIRFDGQGRYIPEEVALKIQSKGPANMPNYDLDGPLPKGVTAIIEDNAPGKPRRGRVDVDHATPGYGTASGQTHEGVGYKDKNEDAIVQGDTWAAVVDGMGGHGRGDKASEIASKALAHYLDAHRNDPDPKKVMRDALIYAGDAVNASPYGKKGSGAVAVVHMVVTNPDGSQKLIVGHVGDAGALVIGKDGTIKYQTSDQGPAGMMMDAEIKGGKSHDEAEVGKRANPIANIVGGCLGAGHEADPIVREFPLEDGDRVVMYSDGIGDAMSSIELANRVRQAKTAKGAQEDIFKTGLDNMVDLNDAIDELRKSGSDKRLPITKEGYIDAQGNIYDLPEGGKVVGKLQAGDPGWDNVKENYGTIKPGERKPYPRNAYIDRSGDIYDAPKDGNLIDHYKKDNMAVHVYFHNPKADVGGSKPPPPSPPRKVGSGAPPPGKVVIVPPPKPVKVKPAVDLPKADGQTPAGLVQFDLGNFEALGQSLVGKIPGLTPQLEEAFRAGDTIDPVLRSGPNGVQAVPGAFVITHRLSGADTIMSTRATPEQFQAYKAWQSYTGFPENGGGSKGISKDQLQAYGAKRGLPISGSGTDLQNEYVMNILNQLPDSFLQAKSPDGYRYLQGVRIGTGRVGMRGAAMGSAFDGDQVHLYRGATEGPRQNLAGLLLHELGHSTGHRYALTASENATDGSKAPAPPDSSIPLEVRQKMHDYHKLLGQKGQIYGLDWMNGAEARVAYTSGSFQEFIAEFHLQYVADGPGLRKYIDSIKDPEAKAAYQYVYNELKNRVFGGKEYGLDAGAGANDAPANPGGVVTSSVYGLSATDNKWTYKMPDNLPQAFLGREAFMGQPGSDFVSTKQVRIFRSNGTTFIEDSMSSNGTEVVRDGKVVWSSRGKADMMKSMFPLRPGDKIVMGKKVEVEFNPS